MRNKYCAYRGRYSRVLATSCGCYFCALRRDIDAARLARQKIAIQEAAVRCSLRAIDLRLEALDAFVTD